jgi:hypothetical protein
MVGLDGIGMDRVLLLAMRRESDLSAAAAALVGMLRLESADGSA